MSTVSVSSTRGFTSKSGIYPRSGPSKLGLWICLLGLESSDCQHFRCIFFHLSRMTYNYDVCSISCGLWSFFYLSEARPRLKLSHNKPPVLHLPLSFPPTSSRLLTPWSTIALHLPTVMARFSTPSVITDHDDEECRGGCSSDPNRTIPMGGYSHVSHVRIYATCRLRRIWFGDIGPSQKVPWEFELYAD